MSLDAIMDYLRTLFMFQICFIHSSVLDHSVNHNKLLVYGQQEQIYGTLHKLVPKTISINNTSILCM